MTDLEKTTLESLQAQPVGAILVFGDGWYNSVLVKVRDGTWRPVSEDDNLVEEVDLANMAANTVSTWHCS